MGFFSGSQHYCLIARAKESQSEVMQATLETVFPNSCVLDFITLMLLQHRGFCVTCLELWLFHIDKSP